MVCTTWPAAALLEMSSNPAGTGMGYRSTAVYAPARAGGAEAATAASPAAVASARTSRGRTLTIECVIGMRPNPERNPWRVCILDPPVCSDRDATRAHAPARQPGQCTTETRRGPRFRHGVGKRGPVLRGGRAPARAHAEDRREDVEVGQVHDAVAGEVRLEPRLDAGAEVGREDVEIGEVDGAVEVRIAARAGRRQRQRRRGERLREAEPGEPGVVDDAQVAAARIEGKHVVRQAGGGYETRGQSHAERAVERRDTRDVQPIAGARADEVDDQLGAGLLRKVAADVERRRVARRNDPGAGHAALNHATAAQRG